MTSPGEITTLLAAARQGDRKAESDLIQIVYKDLHALAQRYMRRERSDHTLQATALVNEAYVRLIDSLDVQDRGHLFATAATVMRRILVDHARSKHNARHGGGAVRVDFDEELVVSRRIDPALVRMDDALTQLAAFDPRKARIVEMRYFGGLTAEDMASVLGVSPQTVNRDWTLARSWLAREMMNPAPAAALANPASGS